MNFIKKRKWLPFLVSWAFLLSSNGYPLPPNDPSISYRVRGVDVSGHYPFLGKKITRLCPVQNGEPFKEEILKTCADRATDLFEKEGYFGTEVEVSPLYHPAQKIVDLKIKVHKGKSVRIGNVEIDGNTIFNDNFLRNKIVTTTRFSPKKVSARLKKVQKLYIKKGYVKAKLKLENASLNSSTQKVDLKIQIEERKHLSVFFVGNHFLRDTTLKRYESFQEIQSYDSYTAERTANRILAFYKQNGFRLATVTYDLETTPTDVKMVFFIFEGPRTRIKNIRFEGNESISDKKLESVMENQKQTMFQQGHLQEDLLPIDSVNIQRYYQSKGFLDSTVDPWGESYTPLGDKALLSLRVHEGDPYILESVEFSGNTLFPSKSLLKQTDLKIGKRYDSTAYEASPAQLKTYYNDKGYPYFEVEPTFHTDPLHHTASVSFKIKEGVLAHVGKITIDGSLLTKNKVILNSLKVKEGDIYDYRKILDGQLNLKRLGIFDHVRIIPLGLDEEKDVIDLLVKVQESKSITFDVQGGYDTDKQFTGQAIFIKRNILGSGKQFQLRGIGGWELSRGEMTLSSPRIFGANWNLVNQYFVQYEDDENFNATSYGGSLGVIKNFGPFFNLLAKTELIHFNLLEDQSNVSALRPHLFDSTFLEPLASLSFDNRDNFADPHRGFNIVHTSQLSSDMSNLSNLFYTGKFNFSHYFSPLRRITLINTLRLGNIFLITDSARVPANNLFFMGGNDTVRGFDEDAINPAGGFTSVLYNVELHYALFDEFKLAGFFDTGSLTDGLRKITKDTFRESAGFGLRYITPVGPIRVDYGFVLDKRPSEKGSRIHLSFGYFF